MLCALSLTVFCALWTTVYMQVNRQPRFTNEVQVIDFFQRGIKENLPINNTAVVNLTCEDPDGNRIQYSAIRTSSVRIDPNTGEIFFTRPLDYEQSVNSNNQNEKANSVTFQCQDYDSNYIPLSDPATLAITITVIDVNDNLPAFSVQSAEGYTLPISEDASVGTTLLPLLSIYDADQGANAQLYSVEFQCSNNTSEEKEGCDTFGVSFSRVAEHNYTVAITLKQRLDYESRVFYKLSLQAVDGLGTSEIPHLTSSVGVRITVSDSQDTNPVFTNQNLNFDIFEGLARGANVSFIVSARDGDSGAKRPIKLEVLDDAMNLFEAGLSIPSPNQVDADRGIYIASLRVRTEIDREKPGLGATYPFTVQATELQNGALTNATATTVFTAHILDINDNGPMFSQSNYSVMVQEMNGMSGTVQIPNLKIDVTDPDEPSNARFKVSITSQSAAGAFGLTPDEITTGTASFYLTVNNFEHFDYDDPTYRTQTLTLQAVEIGENNLPGTKSSSATITVILTDINDNAPVFGQPQYVGSIVENANSTRILTIQATDKDSGVNGQLEYSIDKRVRELFAINPTTGDLSLIGTLDYEKQNSYSFLAFAQDKSGKPLISQVLVTISVLDYNDIGPRFTLPTYTATVSENSIQFEAPVIVQATDGAQREAPITYSILSGNTPNNSFVMNRTSGELTLREPLDFEAIPSQTGIYSLEIQASDNGQPPLTEKTKITVTVLDENDHTPVFVTTQYSKTISEAEKPGTSLLQVSATDGDAGSNGIITYRIGSGARDNFVVNGSGVLRVSNSPNFDYDQFKSYTLQIIAVDGGSPQQSVTATVTITITDANNKPPYFLKNLYNNIVSESTAIGMSVLQVSAQDPDTQYRLQYSIVRTSITAINKGGAQVGSTYPYDFRELFDIEQTTGIIRVKGTLNREYVVEIAFVVKVQDVHETAIGEQTGTSRVTITISGTPTTDLYFNRPWTAENPVYEVGILESVPFDTDIITLQARDPVTGGTVIRNYEEVQELEGGDFFRIGTTSGTVYLNAALDYERGDRTHSVVVRARQDTRTVTATVRILVEDENDNSPRFTQSLYSFRVSEYARYPYKVGVVSAFDPDTATFGPIEYTLRGLDASDFTIFDSATGNSADILVANTLDFEMRKSYTLDIIATDNKYGQGFAIRNQARAMVIITVIDENDNIPKFDDKNRTFTVAETAPINTRLGQVLAKDGDFGLNGAIVYSLLTEDTPNPNTRALQLFSVTPSSAIVLTSASLRGYSGGYNMRLVATDQGSPPQSAIIPITIKVQGAEDDDGTPQWLEPINNYVATVFEHSPNTHVPVIIKANPRTPGAVPIYSFAPFQTDHSDFNINRDNGSITVISDLDRENKENYTLVIVATDSANSTLISRRTLLVRLLDKDDNLPSFKHNYAACPSDFEVPTEFYADDNTPNGTIVAQAVACDPDIAPNNMMYYSLYLSNMLCQQENVDAFIVAINGSIIAKKMLDYEERAEYLVCVKVTSTDPRRRKREADWSVVESDKIYSHRSKRAINTSMMIPNDTVAYIVIKIRDINDQGPKFSSPTATAVLEATPSSSVVTQVSAVDHDGPQHNRVVYRIANTMYYPGDGSQPYTLNTAFNINPNTGIVSTNLPSYGDFKDGYFVLTIIAQDYESSAFTDTMKLTIVMHKRSQILRAVLDLSPAEGQQQAPALIKALNALDNDTQFYFLTASEHKTMDAPVATQTDICFVVVQYNKKAFEANAGIGLIDSGKYAAVLGAKEYEMVNRGTCYSLRSSKQNVKWDDLWWVLVAIALFIFVCCVILLVTICILYDRYKSYMNTQRTYLVPQ